MERERGAGPYRDERPGLVQQMAELEAENVRLRGIIRKGLFWRRRCFRRKFDELVRAVLCRAAVACSVLAGAVLIAGIELTASQSRCPFDFPGGAALPENPTVLISPPLLVFGRLETASRPSESRACPSEARICWSDIVILPPSCWVEWADCDLPAGQAGLDLPIGSDEEVGIPR